MASRSDYRKAFEAARQEHERLRQQRDTADARMTQLQQLMVSLSPLIDQDPPESHTGLMDAIRQTLKAAEDGLRPPEIHDRLKAIGLELPKTNPLAAIHVTLKRLCEATEVLPYRDAKGQKRYRWIGRNITVHLPTGTVTLTGVSARVEQGHLAVQDTIAIQDTINASMQSANVVAQGHAARNRTFAAANATQMVNPLLPDEVRKPRLKREDKK